MMKRQRSKVERRVGVLAAAVAITTVGFGVRAQNEAGVGSEPEERAVSVSADAVPVKPGERPLALMVGEAAPRLEGLEWLRGGAVEAFEPGRVYLVDFWQTWCGGCIAGFPELQAELEAHPELTVIAVARDDPYDSREQVVGFIEAHPELTFRFAFDEDGRAYEAYMKATGSRTLPMSFIVGPDGRLAAISQLLSTPRESFLKGLIAGDVSTDESAEEFAVRLAAKQNYNLFHEILKAHGDRAAVGFLERVPEGVFRLEAGLLAQIAYDLIEGETRGEGVLGVAERYAVAAVEVEPDSPWGLDVRAMVHLERGQTAEAIELYERLLASAESDVMREVYAEKLGSLR